MGFTKFGNYGEGYCPEINWKTARVQEKKDGSLLKVWKYDGAWHISTNNTINAATAYVGESKSITFYGLFAMALGMSGVKSERQWLQSLDPACTYMFELCCPENRVVVPHTDYKLYHIGTRHNLTLHELNVDIGLPKPKEYPLKSFEECLEAAKVLSFLHEGYVVVDGSWNRVKIKSPAYLVVFHLKNNGIITKERVIDLLRSGEHTEFLNYFPEYTEKVEKVQRHLNALEAGLSKTCEVLTALNFETQKDFALHIKDDRFSPFYFEWRKSGITPKEWLDKKESWRLAGYLTDCAIDSNP